MKSHIYVIRNCVNDKVYIGQTRLSLEERFNRHISDSKLECKQHRPLYLAFAKYGIDKFCIELIEDCDYSIADEREIYWIKQYNSNKCGGYKVPPLPVEANGVELTIVVLANGTTDVFLSTNVSNC